MVEGGGAGGGGGGGGGDAPPADPAERDLGSEELRRQELIARGRSALQSWRVGGAGALEGGGGGGGGTESPAATALPNGGGGGVHRVEQVQQAPVVECVVEGAGGGSGGEVALLQAALEEANRRCAVVWLCVWLVIK